MAQQPPTGSTSQQKNDLTGIGWMISEHFEALNRRFDSLEQMTRDMTDRLRWIENQLAKPRPDSST